MAQPEHKHLLNNTRLAVLRHSRVSLELLERKLRVLQEAKDSESKEKETTRKAPDDAKEQVRISFFFFFSFLFFPFIIHSFIHSLMIRSSLCRSFSCD